MLEKQRKLIESAGIHLNAANAEIHFGVGKHCKMTMEAGCELRAGRYEIGRLGAMSYVGGGNSILRNVESIGRFCSIAPNLTTGAVEHPTDFVSAHCLFQGRYHPNDHVISTYLAENATEIRKSRGIYDNRYADEATKVIIGHDVWIGEGVFIRRGVKIGHGAIIASRSVIVKDVEPYSIVGGIPGKQIRRRFDEVIISDLLSLEWWKYGLASLKGVDVSNPSSAPEIIWGNIKDNNIPIWNPVSKTILPDGMVV